jgi:hypothetical protein
MILVQSASSVNASSFFTARFNTDSGANYAGSGSYYEYASTYGPTNFTESTGLTNNHFLIGQMGNSAANTVSSYVVASGCNASGVKQVFYGGFGNGTAKIHTFGAGFYAGTSTISSISVISSSGNFDAGTVYVYTSA